MNDTAQVPASNNKRKRALAGIGGVVVVGAIAAAAYWALFLNHVEGTDNAYVQGNIVQITPQVSGTVIAIDADDTDFVKTGQPLVRLDQADAKVALQQAEAQLAQAVRQVRTLFATDSTYGAQIAQRQAEVARAQADVARAQDDVARRTPLVASGAVGKEEFDHANAQLAAAKSALAAAQSATQAAREQLVSSQAMTQGTTIAQHPSVLSAATRVREAYLALGRTELVAPQDGYVARRSVQIGQRVQAGAPLMTVVALNQVWVDANFKEGQLKNLRIGQPATLEADVYGRKIEYKGHVVGLGAGTGAAFALLPAQNATGNWIKVVQRVPVRIALDAQELDAHPLRVGLSMDVQVDVSDTSGRALADAPRSAPVAQTKVFDALGNQADAEVERIVAANAGPLPRATAQTGMQPKAKGAVAADELASSASARTAAAPTHAVHAR